MLDKSTRNTPPRAGVFSSVRARPITRGGCGARKLDGRGNSTTACTKPAPWPNIWRAAPLSRSLSRGLDRQRTGVETAVRLGVEHLDHRKCGDTLANEAAEHSRHAWVSYHPVSLV